MIDQFQISPLVSPETILHSMKNWAFIAYSDEIWLYYQFSLPHLHISLSKVGRMHFVKWLWEWKGKVEQVMRGKKNRTGVSLEGTVSHLRHLWASLRSRPMWASCCMEFSGATCRRSSRAALGSATPVAASQTIHRPWGGKTRSSSYVRAWITRPVLHDRARSTRPSSKKRARLERPLCHVHAWFTRPLSHVQAWLAHPLSHVQAWFIRPLSHVQAWLARPLSHVQAWFTRPLSHVQAWFTRPLSHVQAWFTRPLSHARAWLTRPLSKEPHDSCDPWFTRHS